LAKGLPIQMPLNYYIDNNPELPPLVTWRGHGNLMFANWLNYYVYQETPYNINDIH
jgi:homoserine O-succinyltransferase